MTRARVAAMVARKQAVTKGNRSGSATTASAPPRVIVLENGVRILLDPMERVRSCAIGFWVEMGGRLERPEELGLTHFIEHMLFKGTPGLDALELADELNRLGGAFNAHTSQETLCLHGRCVDEKVLETLAVFSDMLLDSTYPEAEIRRERNVVLEEYRMYEDSPDELVYDRFFEALWPEAPLGRSVIGRPATIRRFSRAAIDAYLAREFDPSRILISLAGSFDEAAATRMLRARFGGLPRARRAPRVPKGASGASDRCTILRRDVAQAHFCFGGPGPARGARDRYEFGVMNMALGGGMSSRLFKEVREKRGLAYGVHSFGQPFRGAGCFAIAGSTSAGSLDEVMRICMAELDRMCDEPVPERELELAKEQIVDSVLMAVESTSSRMNHQAESYLVHGRVVPPDEIVRDVRAVTAEGVRKAARRYFRGRAFAGAFIGPKALKVRVPLDRGAPTGA